MTDSTISGLSAGHITARSRQRGGKLDRPAVAASCVRTCATADASKFRTRSWASFAPLTFGIFIAAVIVLGWLNRDEGNLTPENGIGYWLGIVGGSLMLLLLLYPLRKRMRFLGVLGTVTFWFRAHMILGVVGPVLILLHANFRLGSINSNVALAAMLIVATSGVVGRYLYTKIHHGLYGRKAQVQEILADADALQGVIGANLPVAGRVVAQLNAFALLGTAAPRGIIAGLFWLPVISMRAGWVRRRLVRDVRQVITVEGKRLGWSRKVRRQQLSGVTELVTLHVAAVKKAAAFAFYDRLFGFWHVLHLPLFFLLVIAATIHIFAAHFF